MVRNLERQTPKESALAFLEGGAGERRQGARALQAGLRKSEARAAAGERATTLRRTFGERQARRALPRVVEQLDEAARRRAPILARIAALSPKEVAPKTPRRAAAAAAGTPQPRPKLPRQQPAQVVQQATPTAQMPSVGQEAPAPGVKPPAPRPARARRVKIGEWEA